MKYPENSMAKGLSNFTLWLGMLILWTPAEAQEVNATGTPLRTPTLSNSSEVVSPVSGEPNLEWVDGLLSEYLRDPSEGSFENLLVPSLRPSGYSTGGKSDPAEQWGGTLLEPTGQFRIPEEERIYPEGYLEKMQQRESMPQGSPARATQ